MPDLIGGFTTLPYKEIFQLPGVDAGFTDVSDSGRLNDVPDDEFPAIILCRPLTKLLTASVSLVD